MPTARLELPPRARFAGQALPPALARALGRADSTSGQGGIEAVFDVLPRGWPAAAVTRQRDAGDAADATWLRADPAFVRPDINGARLLAVGDTLGLDAAGAESLVSALRPLFGDAGLPIDAPQPNRWYLRLPPGSPLPPLATPDEALGVDLFESMPQGAEGRRWRALLSEAQVVLHNHPLNAERVARGSVPVNSVWFWGAGRLPDRVRTPYASFLTRDEAVHAFATLAGSEATALPARWQGVDRDTLVDLRHHRGLDALCADWLEPALADLGTRRLDTLELHWADGALDRLRRGQGWRFWRGPTRMPPEGAAT